MTELLCLATLHRRTQTHASMLESPFWKEVQEWTIFQLSHVL